MLVLSRKPGERIQVGATITVVVLEVRGNRVRLGIEAPEQQAILRGELHPGPDVPLTAIPHALAAADSPAEPEVNLLP